MTLALIDYGSGNIRSAERALIAAGAQNVAVTADPDAVARADRVVLPGQGAFGDCMAGLKAVPGLIEALNQAVIARGAPFLGICVGMQLLADEGLERGAHQGLGWIGGVCRPLAPASAVRIPHMGWNAARLTRPHPLFDALAPEAYVYFAHSYVVDPADPGAAALETDHGERFAAALVRGNIAGVQFHPEKSQAAGLALLASFLSWTP